MELCNYTRPDRTRYYEIEAIEIPIVYNKYGDHDPNGLLYVLKKDADRIRQGALRNFSKEIPQPYEEVKPLVIRANLGETVVITFSHSLDRALSIHVLGMNYDVQTSDGTAQDLTKIPPPAIRSYTRGMPTGKVCTCSTIWAIQAAARTVQISTDFSALSLWKRLSLNGWIHRQAVS